MSWGVSDPGGRAPIERKKGHLLLLKHDAKAGEPKARQERAKTRDGSKWVTRGKEGITFPGARATPAGGRERVGGKLQVQAMARPF